MDMITLNQNKESRWQFFGGGARAGKNSFPPTPFLFARPSDRISEFSIRIFVKKVSNFVQKTPPNCTFCKIIRSCLGASRLGMVFPRETPSIFEGERKRPLGNAEVPVRKHRENEVFRTNLFSFAFGERLSAFLPQGTLSCFAIHLVFDCPKANFKTIWTK